MLDIEGKDEELHQQGQKLKKAEQERISVVEGLSTLRQKIQEDRSRIDQLLQEKTSLENKLSLREHQLQLQQQSATKERELQQQFISLQQKEIAGLEKQLKRVEHELDETKPRLESLQEELKEVSLELEKKSFEVQKLQEVKEVMKLNLDRDRKGLDDRLQLLDKKHAHTASCKVCEICTCINCSLACMLLKIVSR